MATFQEFYDAGNIPEDVIRAFYDISPTDIRFTGEIEQMAADSVKKEWFEHVLNTPDKDNAVPDGADASGDDTTQGDRIWNYCQMPDRNISLGDQAEASDSFGPNITKFETQLEYRTKELYRDFEASALSENASVIPVGNTVAAKSAGFFAFCKTNTQFGAGGADGGFNSGTGVVDAPTPGTTEALSEGKMLTVLEDIETEGGDPNQLQMIPKLKRKFSNFMFTSSARIGAIYTPTPGGEGGATAVGSIQMYESDFGALEVISNRIMQPEDSGSGTERTNLGVIDTQYWSVASQWDPRAKRLGPTGTGENWQVTHSKALCALNERSSGAVRDIDYTLDMVA